MTLQHLQMLFAASVIGFATFAFAQSASTAHFSDMTVFEDDLISGGTSETLSPPGQPLANGGDQMGADEWGGWSRKLSWQFLNSTPQGDVYRFTLVFNWKGGSLATQTKDITYSGRRIVIFEDRAQRIGLKPGFFHAPQVATSQGLLGLPRWSWAILCIIAMLLIFRLRQDLLQRRRRQAPMVEECRTTSLPSIPPIIEYASRENSLRQGWSAADALYLALVIACYLLAGFAQSIMPGGYSWGYDWELANFLMTVAALSSAILFAAGLFSIVVIGRRRTALAILVGTWIASVLPILMFFFGKRWLQNNFA
jgi:hypothetical protein